MLQFNIVRFTDQFSIDISEFSSEHFPLLLQQISDYFEDNYSIECRKTTAKVTIFFYDEDDVVALICALSDWAVECGFQCEDGITIVTRKAVYALPNRDEVCTVSLRDLLSTFCRALDLDSSEEAIDRLVREEIYWWR